MEKIDNIKYILSQLLNLTFQDIGNIVAMDAPLHVHWFERLKSLYCHSSHLHSKE